MQEEVKHYKVKSLPTQLRPNSVYYVKATSQSAVNTYITDQNGFPFPLLDLTGGGNVGVIQSVTGTGVTGTFSNPIINISTFKSSDSGNLIEISSNDGKLFVKPITSPDGSIDIAITASALELQLGVSLQTQIQNALQPGDNISELINDVGYITLADLPFSAVSATAWTPNHTTATGNPYLAGTIVYYLGHVFQANFNNDSITPAIGGNLYWTDLGLGYLIDQEQTDWLAVSGSAFIKNKPTNVSSFTNDAGYLTQDNVVEYANLAAFPVTGVIGTIYIAIDTGLFYSWNGTTYVPSSAPSTGITGVGITNRLPIWTSPTTIGNSKVSQRSNVVVVNDFGRPYINGNTMFSLQRAQSQIDFILGNPGFSQPSYMVSDNQIDGFEIHSKGELALKTGATYANEGLRIFSTGKLKFTQTPDTGTTSDKLLVRDTSGNVKQIDYPTGGGIPHATAAGTDTYTATVTGVAAYNDADAYLIRFTNGNTSSATLNINSLGAIPLYRNNDGPLLGGDILAGGEMLCIYNSTLVEFQVIGISPNSLIAYVTNDDSVTLTKGMPVYAFSGTGDRMTVKRANNTGDATSAQTVGLVLSTSIAANQKGFVMMQGLLDGLSILPTSTWSDGDAVYLGATDGSITNIKPFAPNHLVYLGVVTTASNGAAGRMYVRVQNGYELQELHNVQAQTPSLKDTLWYDNTVTPAQWKTASIPTILGYTPEAASTRRNANNSTNNNINYCGVASGIGVSESATVWTIKRLTIGASGSINIATATNVAWINRETETYI